MFSGWLTQQRNASPSTIRLACSSAIIIVTALWYAGVDRGAMEMLLAGLLFVLAPYSSYISDPRKGGVSFKQGCIAGGIITLIYVPAVVCRYSYVTRGIPLPSSFFELFMLVLSLFLFIPLGAALGGMTTLIGDYLVRTACTLIRKWLSTKKGKAILDQSSHDRSYIYDQTDTEPSLTQKLACSDV